MVNIKSSGDVIKQLLDYYRVVRSDLDTKPGTVARDLFVDGPASQLGILYDELGRISDKQSIRLVNGSDLDKLAQNFGLTRKQPSSSSGMSLFTFSSIDSNIDINAGDLVFASNGFSFTVNSGVAITPGSANFFKSIATKFRDQLDFAGIDDEYAALVSVSANTPGTAGNIGAYALNRTNVAGVSHVTNIDPFGGGTDQESESAFKNRILSTFSGSSVGTALGYLNTALVSPNVSDATIIEPGDVLMTRDGTVVSETNDGTKTIVSEGSGGKVDVVVLGSLLVQKTDSFIYRDASNNNDPTDKKNDFVLGQISSDEGKSISRKRIDNISTGILPAQPVDTIVQVAGSSSGSNFAIKTIDEYGRTSGNFELSKDNGVFAGSPWGFDTFKWTSDRISDFGEDRIKGQYNSQDSITYTDVTEISSITQNVSITNENSNVTSNRSIIQLLHYPSNNVTRVFNVNTGEVYIVTNQGIDAELGYNPTGKITISGNTLPSVGDVLQVDYNWVLNYDQYSDYDGLVNTDNIRDVTDSVDWGYSSLIREEKILFELDSEENFFEGRATNPVGTVVSTNKVYESIDSVTRVTVGVFINRLAVVVKYLPEETVSVDSVKINNTTTETYSTDSNDGTFINSTEVENGELINVTTIILPTDAYAVEGDVVLVSLNNKNVFFSNTLSGSFNGNRITIPSELLNTSAGEIYLYVKYISSLTDLFSVPTTSLPASKLGNGYNYFDNSGPKLNRANISRSEHQIVKENLSSQKYISLNLSSTEYSLNEKDILAVIRVSDGYNLWTSGNTGTIEVESSVYNLILSGINSPLENDSVLVIYYAHEVRRFQPFTFNNSLINTFVTQLWENPQTHKYEIDLNKFTSQSSGLTFSIVEPNTDIEVFSITDGYLESGSGHANISSLTADFSSEVDLTKKKVLITGADDSNNDGLYDILSYDLNTNKIKIYNNFNNINETQISILRIADNSELWSLSGTVDYENNVIIFDKPNGTAVGDFVFVNIFNYTNLRQSPTIIAGTITDQVVNSGVITIKGTTLTLVEDAIFTATANGLQQDLSEAIRKHIGLNSNQSLPANIKIAKIMKAENVTTASVTDNTVLSVNATYNVDNSQIKDNVLYSRLMVRNSNLGNFQFILPSTPNNTLDVETHNLPSIGDKIRISFYYVTENDSESLSYTRNGILFTNKRFAFIDRVYIASGFKNSQSTKFTVTLFTQPTLGARYKVYYDYIAPKQNERIVIKYNYNKLIGDVTLNLEETRPINADVLVRGAKTVLLDLIINVVIDPKFTTSTSTVLQNLRDQMTDVLTTNQLEDVIDTVTIINKAESVDGISRARIIYFNKHGNTGSILKYAAAKDEFFASNEITINTETR